MHRFFVDKQNIHEKEQRIFVRNPDDIKHMSKVLRLDVKDIVEICNGEGFEYIAKIVKLEKNSIHLEILEGRPSSTESPVQITIIQGIPKSGKMEMIIQKNTELGVFQIIPLITNRTVVQLKDKKSEDKKIERWQKIADEAAKQCKRGVIPVIKPPITFEDLFHMGIEYDLMMIPYEKEESMGIKKVLKDNHSYKKIAVIIGPEGGFEEDEIKMAMEQGIIPVTLGPRILRTETAGMVATALLMYELGDLGI